MGMTSWAWLRGARRTRAQARRRARDFIRAECSRGPVHPSTTSVCTELRFVYIGGILNGRSTFMAPTRARTVPKNFRLDPDQIARAKKALGTATETETIVVALDHVIAEAARNRMAEEANHRFLK